MQIKLILHYFINKENNSIQKVEFLGESDLGEYLEIYKKVFLWICIFSERVSLYSLDCPGAPCEHIISNVAFMTKDVLETLLC